MMKNLVTFAACFSLSACITEVGEDDESVDESELDVAPVSDTANCYRPNLKTTVLLTDRYGRAVDGCSTAMYQMVLSVTNAGCATSGATTFKFQRKDSSWLTVPLASIAPGVTVRAVTTTMTYSGLSEYALSAKADPSNLVAESNESDNSAYWNCIR
jgi:hypothetical protein